MVVKISLPKYVWDSIIEYGGYKEHLDVIEVTLRTKFIPRIKEFASHYKYGNVKWMKEHYKFILYGKSCIIADDFITEIYDLLEKENLFIELSEIEYLFSYSLMVFLAEDLDKFYDNSLPDVAHT